MIWLPRKVFGGPCDGIFFVTEGHSPPSERSLRQVEEGSRSSQDGGIEEGMSSFLLSCRALPDACSD